MIKYRIENADKIKEQRVGYMKTYTPDKDKRLENSRKYRENHKEKLKISGTIGRWKNRGVIHDDFDALYKEYINTHNCNVCKCEFKNSRDRQLDHDHETGLFRQVLCKKCNNRDMWKKLNI